MNITTPTLANQSFMRDRWIASSSIAKPFGTRHLRFVEVKIANLTLFKILIG